MVNDILRTKAKLISQLELKRKDLALYNLNKLENLLKVEFELLYARTEKFQRSEKGIKNLQDLEDLQAELIEYRKLLDSNEA